MPTVPLRLQSTPIPVNLSSPRRNAFTLIATGSQVTLLQQLLISDGDLAPQYATGYYGALTEQAVEAFHAKYGIVTYGSPDTTGYGAVGPMTRGQLNTVGL